MIIVVVAAKEDHQDRDCFAVAVLSHGDDNGILFGTDKTITVDNLLKPIKDCASLAGKPKICIFQVGCVTTGHCSLLFCTM